MPLHTQAWSAYLEQLGLPTPDAAIASRMHGKRNDDIVEDFIGRGLDPPAVFEHGAAKERLYRQLMATRLKEHLVRGVEAFLMRYEGLPMAVASNAEPANVDMVLDGAGLRSRFRVVVDGQQVDRPKPFPDVYLRAASLLGVSPRKCIVFEDSPTGVEAGRSAGMQCGAGWKPAADWQSACCTLSKSLTGRLPIGRRLSTCPTNFYCSLEWLSAWRPKRP